VRPLTREWHRACARTPLLCRDARTIIEALASKTDMGCTDKIFTTNVKVAEQSGEHTKVAMIFAFQAVSTRQLVAGQVPGLGEVGVDKVRGGLTKLLESKQLKDHFHTPSAVQLVGAYFILGNDGFKNFLTTLGCRDHCALQTLGAIEEHAVKL